MRYSYQTIRSYLESVYPAHDFEIKRDESLVQDQAYTGQSIDRDALIGIRHLCDNQYRFYSVWTDVAHVDESEIDRFFRGPFPEVVVRGLQFSQSQHRYLDDTLDDGPLRWKHARSEAIRFADRDHARDIIRTFV